MRQQQVWRDGADAESEASRGLLFSAGDGGSSEAEQTSMPFAPRVAVATHRLSTDAPLLSTAVVQFCAARVALLIAAPRRMHSSKLTGRIEA